MFKILINNTLLILMALFCSFAIADTNIAKQDFDQLKEEFNIHKQVIEIKLDANDKRLADFSIHTTAQGTQTAWVSNLIAIMGIGITIVSIAAGFAIYNGAAEKAKNEARGVAESWLNDNYSKIQNRIIELEDNANRFHLQITELEEKAFASIARMDRDSERVTAAATSAENAVRHAAERLISKSNSPSSEVGKPNKDDQIVIQQANDFLKQKPENKFSASDHYVRGVSFFTAGNYQNSLESFSSAIELSKNSTSSERANYLMAKSTALSRLNRDIESFAILDELSKIGSDFDLDDYTLIQVLINKAVSLNKLGSLKEEIDVYDLIISKFDDTTDPHILDQLVKALHYKALTLALLNKSDQALTIFESAIRRFKNNSDEKVRAQLVRLMFGKAVHQMKEKRFDEEISTYDEILSMLDEDNPNLNLRKQIIKAKLFKAMTLSSTDRILEAFEIYQHLENNLKEEIDPELRENLANIMLGKARCLDKLKRPSEELAAYKSIQEFFKDELEPNIRNVVARASWLKGLTIESTGDGEGALKAYQELATQFEMDNDPSTRQTRIAALGASLRILRAKNRLIEEEDLYQKIESQYRNDDSPEVQFRLAEILLNRIEKLISMDEPETKISALTNLIIRFAKEDLLATREIVAAAIESKIILLKKLNRDEEASKTFEAMDSEFKNETSSIIQKIISQLRDDFRKYQS